MFKCYLFWVDKKIYRPLLSPIFYLYVYFRSFFWYSNNRNFITIAFVLGLFLCCDKHHKHLGEKWFIPSYNLQSVIQEGQNRRSRQDPEAGTEAEATEEGCLLTRSPYLFPTYCSPAWHHPQWSGPSSSIHQKKHSSLAHKTDLWLHLLNWALFFPNDSSLGQVRTALSITLYVVERLCWTRDAHSLQG